MKRLNYQQLSAPAAQALFQFSKVVEGLEIDPLIKELIKIRSSQLNGCLFCLDMHVKEAKLHGEQELRLYHLTAWRESPLFTEKERAALEWTELLTKIGAHGVEDTDYANALRHFSEKELSDLTFGVTAINAWNRLGVAFRTTPGAFDKMLGLDKAGLSIAPVQQNALV